MPFFYYYDPTYILVLIGAVLSLWASATVKSTYNKYSRVYSYSGLTGAQAAAQILRQAGIYDVRIEHVSGNLTDHYDPKARVLRLSDSVYGSNSVAAIGVAAHECGHAIQDQEDYVPFCICAGSESGNTGCFPYPSSGCISGKLSFPDPGGAAVLLLWCTVPADHFAGRV